MLDTLQSFLAPYYLYIKFFHVLFVMMWGFSAIGAFWLVYVAGKERRQHRDNKELLRRDDWVRWHFNNALKLEHTAFPMILITGLALLVASRWGMDYNWLFWKLVIVVAIFIPMEILDTWLSHFHVPKAMRERDTHFGNFKRALKRQDVFLRYSSWIVLIFVPGVIFLALVKPI